MRLQDLAESVEREAGKLIRCAVEHAAVESGDVLALQLSPAHGARDEALRSHVVQDPRAGQFVDGGRPIVGCSRLRVQRPGGVDDCRRDSPSGEEEGEQQAGWTRSDHDDLRRWSAARPRTTSRSIARHTFSSP